MESIENSVVSEWYRDKTVFITGGTGFMGKVLVEKLLRSCPVKKIYMLVRSKRGADVRQRVDDMFAFKVSHTRNKKMFIIFFSSLLVSYLRISFRHSPDIKKYPLELITVYFATT